MTATNLNPWAPYRHIFDHRMNKFGKDHSIASAEGKAVLESEAWRLFKNGQDSFNPISGVTNAIRTEEKRGAFSDLLRDMNRIFKESQVILSVCKIHEENFPF